MDKPRLTAALQRVTTTFKVTVFRSSRTKQVLFVEAGKDFVDTLLSFLVLPMGTIINLLSQEQSGIQVKSLGGISCIFDSLDSSFMQVDKNLLVQSRPSVEGCTCQPRTSVQFQHDLVTAEIMPPSEYYSFAPIIYGCNADYCSLYSSKHGAECTGHEAYKSCYYAGVSHSGQRHKTTVTTNGYVKENMKFIVTDKLEIIHESSINTIMSLLKKLELTSVEDSQSDEITVSITQVVELLHSALVSKQCLNDVFGKEREYSELSVI